MATDAEIIRELHEAQFEFQKALAQEVARDDLASLPRDVRDARAGLATITEAERYMKTRIAFEQMHAERGERWVVAHEALAILRVGGPSDQ